MKHNVLKYLLLLGFISILTVNCSRVTDVKTIILKQEPSSVTEGTDEEHEGSIKKVYTHDIISTLSGENVSLQYIGWITGDRILAHAVGENDSYYVLVDENFGFLHKIAVLGDNISRLSLSDDGRYVMYETENEQGNDIRLYDFSLGRGNIVYHCKPDEKLNGCPGFSSDNKLVSFCLSTSKIVGNQYEVQYAVILYSIVTGKSTQFDVQGIELSSCDTVVPQLNGGKIVFYSKRSATVSNAATLVLTFGSVINGTIYNNFQQTIDLPEDETLDIIYGNNIVVSKTKIHIGNNNIYFSNKYGELRWMDGTYYSKNNILLNSVSSFRISESSECIAYTSNSGANKKSLYIATIKAGIIENKRFIYSLQNADIISWNNKGDKLLIVEEVHNKKVYRILELNQ